MNQTWDVVVVGAGINGAGIAAEAASRGLNVLLIDRKDIASETSSASSKLIHGGLRYLEQGHIALVKKALKEREILLQTAPNLVKPLEIIIPQNKNIRKNFLLRAGLYLYNFLAKKSIRTKAKTPQNSPEIFSILNANYNAAFSFFDATTDDSRLALANANKAAAHGACVLNYHELVHATAYQGEWRLTIQHDNKLETIYTKFLINATGPWVNDLNSRIHIESTHKMKYVQGSHILVDKQYEGNHAYLLQNTDKRVVFVIPYQHKTLIGTTETDIKSPDDTKITHEEIDYLINTYNQYFKQQLSSKNIIYTWSGARPLIDDKSEITKISRDYAYDYQTIPGPCISIYGGKLTTYRLLAESVVDAMQSHFPELQRSSSKSTPLIGNVMGQNCFIEYKNRMVEQYKAIPKALINRYIDQYGDKIETLLYPNDTTETLGKYFGHNLYQREVEYLINHEWAKTVDDILWRRTKLGIYFEDKSELIEFISKY